MAVLTDKQRAELKLIFQKFDKDGDGQLTANELKAAFQKMEVPMSDLDIADMIGQADSDGSGTIDFNEYCSYKVALDETKIKEYFDKRDVSGDGFLDAQEVFLMAREMGYKRLKLKHAKELIAKVDQDKDGKINFEEFKLLRKITKL